MLQMIRVKLFDGAEKDLVAYNGQALLNFAVEFFTEECDSDLDEDEEDFTFPSYVSSYFRVYNERLGKRIKNISASRSGASLVLNTNDMTFEDPGNYYYEIGYVQTGGYEIVLMYGTLNVK
jgi:hypothetical protein